MSSVTSLGRVQPLYKGTYQPNVIYYRLDNVFYNGSTWVCQVETTSGATPSDGSNIWQKVAERGATGSQGLTGSFGTPTGTVTMHSADDPSATVTVTASGPDTAKIFDFNFDLPQGPVGFDNVVASASALSAGSQPTASAELVVDSSGGTEETTLSFQLGIPAADGSGIKSIDSDVFPDASGNATLTAVRYGASQSISDAQKLIARQNIGAIKNPTTTKTIGHFLKYIGVDAAGEDNWATQAVDVFPSGGAYGYFLQKTSSGTQWAPVNMVPSGGAANSVLTKLSSSDYDLTWATVISNSDIDDIMSDI